MKTKDAEGKVVTLTKEGADLDVYVFGFVCKPFTSTGESAGWKDENSETFWSVLKTIIILRPRVFVLENVKAISNSSNSEVVNIALGGLTARSMMSRNIASGFKLWAYGRMAYPRNIAR